MIVYYAKASLMWGFFWGEMIYMLSRRRCDEIPLEI